MGFGAERANLMGETAVSMPDSTADQTDYSQAASSGGN